MAIFESSQSSNRLPHGGSFNDVHQVSVQIRYLTNAFLIDSWFISLYVKRFVLGDASFSTSRKRGFSHHDPAQGASSRGQHQQDDDPYYLHDTDFISLPPRA